MQATQLFANRALDRVIGADRQRSDYYNAQPNNPLIPGETNKIAAELSKKPSSQNANQQQKEQLAKAAMRTAIIHESNRPFQYEETGATARERGHFDCLKIIRNVSNYLAQRLRAADYRDWNEQEMLKGTVQSLFTPQVMQDLKKLQGLCGISQNDFSSWFAEAICEHDTGLSAGLQKANAWHWHDQDVIPGAKRAGGGGGVAGGHAGGGVVGKAVAPIPDTITDLAGNQLPLNGEGGFYTIFKESQNLLSQGFINENDIKLNLRQIAMRNFELGNIVFSAYENDLYDKLSQIYAAEQRELATAAVLLQRNVLDYVHPRNASGAAFAGGAGAASAAEKEEPLAARALPFPVDVLATIDDFDSVYKDTVGKALGTLIENPGPMMIMGVYDPYEHNEYGQLSESGMRLAFIDWESSQLGKPKNGYMGTDVGYYQFRLEQQGRGQVMVRADGSRILVNTMGIHDTVHHNTVKHFYQNAQQAFARGFKCYAGVVRSSSLRSGHYFALFVQKGENNKWNVYAINPSGKPESRQSAIDEVLAPFVEYLQSQGDQVEVEDAIVTGFQERRETCGFWAVILARAVCTAGSIDGINKLYDWLMNTNPAIENFESINTIQANPVKLADIVKYRYFSLLDLERSDKELALKFAETVPEREYANKGLPELRQDIQRLGHELAQQFGANYQEVLNGPSQTATQKFRTMEEIFAQYHAQLIDVLDRFFRANPVDLGRRVEGMDQSALDREDARVAPLIKEFHKKFIEEQARAKGNFR